MYPKLNALSCLHPPFFPGFPPQFKTSPLPTCSVTQPGPGITLDPSSQVSVHGMAPTLSPRPTDRCLDSVNTTHRPAVTCFCGSPPEHLPHKAWFPQNLIPSPGLRFCSPLRQPHIGDSGAARSAHTTSCGSAPHQLSLLWHRPRHAQPAEPPRITPALCTH